MRPTANAFASSQATPIYSYRDSIDDNPYNLVPPPDKQLYVGWTEPGEWFNLTVEVARAGVYTFDLLYVEIMFWRGCNRLP